MTIPAKRRLLADYKNFVQGACGLGVLIRPKTDNMMECEALIFGPDDTPWEGGIFRLLMTFND